MAQQTPPPVLTELKLSPAMQETVNGALGRGRIDDSAQARRTVYDSSPEIERSMDKDQKGLALIIDLDSVDGFFGGAVLKMRR